jgi:hypothetical protein
MTNKSASAELTPLSNLMKIPVATPSTPLLVIGNLNRLNKYSSNINQQDSALFNLTNRSDTNQDYIEKKLFIVSLMMIINREFFFFISSKENALTSSIDASRFCRFIFPDSTSAIILANNSTNTIQQAINRLFAKRGITWYRTELYTTDQVNIIISSNIYFSSIMIAIC